MNFGDMFKNMGALKGQMEAFQQRIKKLVIAGEAGAGLVKVTLNGEGTVLNIQVDDSLLDKNNKDMLEELLISAMNDGSKKLKEAVSHEMKNAVGMNLPGLDKLFGG
ncbi:MAG: YbaB/EbfC family nucleoid-associated protein [Spirochaetia bacterium]|nr:YbaB/EbfC family nucleoid-associated protein [Spirochaetia bacterium]